MLKKWWLWMHVFAFKNDFFVMIPEWIIDKQGKLTRPAIFFFAALTKLPEHRLENLVFGFNASPKNKAETWGIKKIRINPDAYAHADDPEWLGTIVHELTHEFDYYKSKLPDFLIRFFDQSGIKFRQYILQMTHEKAYKLSSLEKKAFANQKIVMDFVHKFYIQKILSDSSISESEKITSIVNFIKKNKPA